MKLLIGTHNRAKQQDFQRSITSITQSLGLQDLELCFPQDIGISEDIEETGATFQENSSIKARYYFDQSNIPTISDDGGIIIPILNNEPGVKSRRWLGYDATDQELIEYCLMRMAPYPDKEDRLAYFMTCITYFDGKQEVQKIGRMQGYITTEALSRDGMPAGFPFRALFKLPNDKYYDELSEEEHKQMNHRDKALIELFQELQLPSL